MRKVGFQMSLRLIDSYVAPFVSEEEIGYMQPLVDAAHKMLHEKSGQGNAFLGWLDLPRDYDPREVTSILNGMRSRFLCVRGNCDAEVDQMVLNFPITADSMMLYLDGRAAFVTHGHLFNTEQLPPLCPGDLLIHGHTHEKRFEAFGENNLYINPGSIALPKDDDKHSYMVYEDSVFVIRDAETGAVLKEYWL